MNVSLIDGHIDGSKMSDGDIIKALEIHSNEKYDNCEGCPYLKGDFCEGFTKHSKPFRDVLDLLKRKDAEIKELESVTGLMKNREYYNKFVKEVFQNETGNELLFPDFDEIYKRYFEQKAEIERLQKAIKVQDIMIGNQDLKIKGAKNEAIKEFAERLKLKINLDMCEAIDCSDYLYDLPKSIDNLVKEMVGDE